MTELPPDVRDRAAKAVHEVIERGLSNYAVVDAVAAVVAPEIERPLQARVENLLAHNAEHRAQADDLQEWNERLETERDALKARVAELEGTLSDNRKLWDESIAQTGAALELHNVARARVDLLTTALTEMLDIVDACSYLTALSNGDHDRVEHARAVLSATPTAPTPHTCQLPDIATVREPSRRWDCRVCDARWIAMGRIVGRRSRYEWHQMPVTKTATPAKEAP